MDALHRLTQSERGNWTGSAVSNRTGNQLWTLDQVGNWTHDKLDLTGDNDYSDAGEYQEDNTFSLANELQQREQDTNNTAGYENTIDRVLGRDPDTAHRLLCGDCTDPAQVRRLMDGQRAAIMATDPPYLVDYDGTNHPGSSPGKRNKSWSGTYGLTWDDSSGNPGLYEKFLAVGVAEATRPNAALYIWHASRRQAMLEFLGVKMVRVTCPRSPDPEVWTG